MSKIPIGFPVAGGTYALGRKDAVHTAIVATASKHPLRGGQRVRFTDDTLKEAVPCTTPFNEESTDNDQLAHAIVDPFLGDVKINPGVVFWAFLHPGTTPNLTHNFDVTLKSMEEGMQEHMHEEWCSGYGC